ncbi:MAG: hypothetical protein WDN45_08070 [Caulobacteraceae bacterium]
MLGEAQPVDGEAEVAANAGHDLGKAAGVEVAEIFPLQALGGLGLEALDALMVVGTVVVDGVSQDAGGLGLGGGLAVGGGLFLCLQGLDQLGLQHEGLAHGAGDAGIGHGDVAFDHHRTALGLGLQRHRDLQPRLGEAAENGELALGHVGAVAGRGGFGGAGESFSAYHF